MVSTKTTVETWFMNLHKANFFQGHFQTLKKPMKPLRELAWGRYKWSATKMCFQIFDKLPTMERWIFSKFFLWARQCTVRDSLLILVISSFFLGFRQSTLLSVGSFIFCLYFFVFSLQQSMEYRELWSALSGAAPCLVLSSTCALLILSVIKCARISVLATCDFPEWLNQEANVKVKQISLLSLHFFIWQGPQDKTSYLREKWQKPLLQKNKINQQRSDKRGWAVSNGWGAMSPPWRSSCSSSCLASSWWSSLHRWHATST